MKKLLLMFVVFALAFTMALVPALADNHTDVNDTVDINDTVINNTDDNETADVECTTDVDCESSEYCSEDNECKEVEDEVDEHEDEEDYRPFATANGAKMRLLQLERSLVKQTAMAEIIIDEVNDSEDLEAILEELKDLKDEVVEEKESVDEMTRDTAKTYVELKHSAIELSKEFRDTLRGQLSKEELRELRESLEIDADTQEELDEITDEIQIERNAHNYDRFQKFFDRLGIEDEELMDEIRDGKASMGHIKKAIGDNYREKSMQAKERASQMFREHKVKSKVFKDAARDHAKADFDARMQERRDAWEEHVVRFKERFADEERPHPDEERVFDGKGPHFGERR